MSVTKLEQGCCVFLIELRPEVLSRQPVLTASRMRNAKRP